MTQIDPQIAFQMHFQKLMHDVFSQTNSCIQEVNDYMYQLQMNILLQTTQMQQQPQQQQCYMQMPQCTSYMPMSQMMPQQQWQYPQQSQINMYQSVAPTVVTPVVVQPPTPPPSVPKFVTPKVTVTPPPPPPIVKLRIKTKPKELEDGQLTPPSPITSNRNSLIDELRNSGGRKSLRKTSRKEIPKKEEPLPAWIRSRDREKRSSFNPPPNAFETLEALLLAKDHQKSMPNLRTLSRANSDERKSVTSPLASPTEVEEEKVEEVLEKPKPPTNTNVAAAVKAAALEADLAAAATPHSSSPEASHTSSTEIIPRECDENDDVVEAVEGDLDPHPLIKKALPTTSQALVLHRQLNSEYPDAPHGWDLLMWTIRRVGKFLKKHDEHEKKRKDDWELIHHKH